MLLMKYHNGDQIKEDEIGDTCDMRHVRGEIFSRKIYRRNNHNCT